MSEGRCPWAIKYGVVLHTRCIEPAGHPGNMHTGRGLSQFPYQRVNWYASDRREYRTTRDEEFSWEEPA